MSAPETGEAWDRGLFGFDGFSRPTYRHISVEYPRWWDDDPNDVPSREEALIDRALASRDEAAVARQDREMQAWIERNTQEGVA